MTVHVDMFHPVVKPTEPLLQTPKDKKVGAGPFAVVTCGWGLFVLLGCYAISWAKGAVVGPTAGIWHWPMVSDCFVVPPASYLSRFGVISCACMLWVNSFAFYFYLKSGKVGGRKCTDHLAMTLASLACGGMAVVGAVNEKENNTIHSTGAVTFFLGYNIYMILGLIRMRDMPDLHPTSRAIKITCSALGFTSLVIFALVTLIKHHQLAFFEWVGTISILVFNLSFYYDFNKKVYLETVDM